MEDVDRALARLASAPISEAFEGFDDRVLARLDRLGGERRPSLAVAGAGAAVFALILGMTAGADIGRRGSPTQDVAGLFGEPPYALSTLFGAS